jgi:hypothetical protein
VVDADDYFAGGPGAVLLCVEGRWQVGQVA